MDETRQLLKIFGVAVTDFEAEAAKLKSVAEQFTAGTDKAEVAGHLKNDAKMCRELSTRGVPATVFCKSHNEWSNRRTSTCPVRGSRGQGVVTKHRATVLWNPCPMTDPCEQVVRGKSGHVRSSLCLSRTDEAPFQS